ncbi:polysaccharide lyase [Russula earlei]|uniref:Polysaccharide lyase n=1 Tax=Russula earlei TaxID=71964 RepID=A0ACC0TUP3_9AGAM|nr:polysaccharide lyase [Russula earlei]
MNKFLSFILFLFTLTSCHAQINVHDDFEAPGLSSIWSTDRMVPGSFEIQSAIARNGHSAAKISLRKGDVFEAGRNGNADSERDELREADKLVSVQDNNYEYRFSLFMPDSFPVVPVRLVIAQWKQYCGHGICDDDSPVLAIRYVAGRLYITVQTDSSTQTVYQTTAEMRGHWLDFRCRTRFSTANGQVDIWLNEQPIVSYKGATCYSQQRGYPAKNHFYFKMGLYRNVMPRPMSIYIDDYSKKEL